jgi:hypothetical protein
MTVWKSGSPKARSISVPLLSVIDHRQFMARLGASFAASTNGRRTTRSTITLEMMPMVQRTGTAVVCQEILGPDMPQEDPQAFAQAIVDVDH